MKSRMLVGAGLILVLLGLLWAGQGFGWIGGSPMTGQTLWAVVGPIVAVVGVICLAVGIRAGQPR